MRFRCEAFTDAVSGERVNLYLDRVGRWWLATGPWRLFRVPCKNPTAFIVVAPSSSPDAAPHD